MDAMSLFDYIMIPPAIVLGLALTHVLSGFGRVVHRLAGHGRPIRLDWVHLAWVAHIFVWMVFFWWYSYAWTANDEWSLLVFIFLIVYTILLYLMCVILVPSDLDDVAVFADYFMTLRRWFFGGVILLILVDFADSAVKGWDNVLSLGLGYVSLRASLLAGSIVAIRTDNRSFHGIFAVVAFAWTFAFFWLNRPTISAV
ncbi:MAG: hypothetical protein OEW59_06050 [Gammaproteobacteria bacterium]|nr:hypothetical protein [Gammaproteobacteria bacterium]